VVFLDFKKLIKEHPIWAEEAKKCKTIESLQEFLKDKGMNISREDANLAMEYLKNSELEKKSSLCEDDIVSVAGGATKIGHLENNNIYN
jgi:hypothetical protein